MGQVKREGRERGQSQQLDRHCSHRIRKARPKVEVDSAENGAENQGGHRDSRRAEEIHRPQERFREQRPGAAQGDDNGYDIGEQRRRDEIAPARSRAHAAGYQDLSQTPQDWVVAEYEEKNIYREGVETLGEQRQPDR